MFTASEKLVMDYARLSFLEIEQLPIDVYLGLRRDAFIYKLNKTEKGREYLENCWIMEQTNPDKERLKQLFDNGTK